MSQSGRPMAEENTAEPTQELSPSSTLSARGGSEPEKAADAEIPLPRRYWSEISPKVDWMLVPSILSVACWSLAGNACRLALHAAFLKVPFFTTYEFFGPNCVGSCAMGLFSALIPESDLPLVQRGLCVGFCGSFTTFSSWVVDIVNKNTAGHAFEELISGITMPFVFLLLGRDAGNAVKHVYSRVQDRGSVVDEPAPHHDDGEDDSRKEHQHRRRRLFMMADLVFLVLSAMAAIAVPVGIQVRINQGAITRVTTRDMRAVGIAPAGAVPRYLLSVFFNKVALFAGFPVGTLAANALGCFLVVFMDCFNYYRPENAWYWVMSNGICGALSTVSSFANEVVGFYSGGRLPFAYVYVLVTLAVTITIGAVGRRRNFSS